jgi:hypothetical protein
MSASGGPRASLAHIYTKMQAEKIPLDTNTGGHIRCTKKVLLKENKVQTVVF